MKAKVASTAWIDKGNMYSPSHRISYYLERKPFRVPSANEPYSRVSSSFPSSVTTGRHADAIVALNVPHFMCERGRAAAH